MVNIKKIIAFSSLALVMTLSLGGITAKASDTNFNVSRVAGADRIATADSLAEKQFASSKTDNVVLVNGYGYADAVSATPLAKLLKAPILLTSGGSSLESEVSKTISDIGAKNVYIVGGTGVVSSSIETSLDSNYTVERIQGTEDTTRMGTNAAVAEKVISMGGQKTAMLVNGKDGYADALSVAAIAAQKGYPVLLASSTDVSDVVKDVISENSLTVKAVGGDAVLPQSVVSSVNGTKVTGNTANRYATNLAVLDYFNNNGGIDFSTIYLAMGGVTNTQFADALVASAAAANNGSPLVLTSQGPDSYSVNARNYIINKNGGANIIIVGGTGVVTPSVESLYDPFSIIDIE
ncbi:MAG: cell wall-binding repeat-containing protein [Clostridium tyrobutyricum]|jgi:putative cell wall-binding protein|uniref:cell wall-binding repeat-containing protein n=1 Tax=Clostridium tyrobutyricum TaxID=1519 RepID=UPI001C3827C1|nr:cell wall-binding repeat-containing protein [Clostridium tyrobutyricum]MBV4425478.1 cell wall-binding repeat-containing protein [Clostridium tyrobutyricum]MCH4199697.1 cell wall-binding repeat-containing protein [Clostridium tyrobutyricum]MCH4236443.1 cell wall-binding repeat-containing protein [Clostridium tyrobutyricum]MCH4258236.1 cell wall-binding repeat-containing protein [Clostridium tyrobutyricum]MCI1239405.1 cell wall-binding repeat-containing protein [Clostridium tyrobutyricum]